MKSFILWCKNIKKEERGESNVFGSEWMGRKVYFCMWALLCLSMRSHSQTMKKRDDFESVRDIGKSREVLNWINQRKYSVFFLIYKGKYEDPCVNFHWLPTKQTLTILSFHFVLSNACILKTKNQFYQNLAYLINYLSYHSKLQPSALKQMLGMQWTVTMITISEKTTKLQNFLFTRSHPKDCLV